MIGTHFLVIVFTLAKSDLCYVKHNKRTILLKIMCDHYLIGNNLNVYIITLFKDKISTNKFSENITRNDFSEIEYQF